MGRNKRAKGDGIMRKVWAIAVCLSLLIILCGCATMYVDADSVIRVGVDGKFTLALDADPEAGYQWFASYDESRLDLVKSWHDGDDEIRGSRGVQYIKFKAIRAGNAKIELIYHSRYLEVRPDDKRVEFEVDIR